MGLPTNEAASRKGCEPKASTCIIWQGKNIDCIEICKGDSIDDVIHQLGCLLCTVIDQMDVDTYNWDCFNLPACDRPHTFREYQQFLMDIVCQLQKAFLNGDAGVAVDEQGIPTVSVAECFHAALGNSALITDYIVAIGNKVCQQEITIQNQQNAIQQLQDRLEVLEA